MAVIREKRQYLSQPIGVVRASVADTASTKAMSDLADTMLSNSYRALMQDAEQRGTELGQSASSKALRTINPETGMPEAFDAPPQFGRAASRAYQSVVERRYVKEVEADLTAASARFFAETYLKPNGFELYSKEMRKHAENMVEDALPRFKNIVSGIGSSVTASTEAEFIKRRALRDAEVEAANLQNDSVSEGQQLSAVINTIDLSNPASLPEQKGALRGSLQAQQNAYSSGTQTIEQLDVNTETLVRGYSKGLNSNLARVIARSRTDQGMPEIKASHLLQLQNVIDSGGFGKDALPEALKPFADAALSLQIDLESMDTDGNARTITRNFSSLVKNEFLTGLSGEYTNAIRTEAVAESALTDKQKNDALSFRLNMRDPLNGGINNAVDSAIELALSGDVQGGLDSIVKFMNDTQSQAMSLNKDGKIVVEEGTISDMKSQAIKGFLKGAGDLAFTALIPYTDADGKELRRPMNSAEAVAFTQYIDRNTAGTNLDDVPEAIRPIAKMIRENNAPLIQEDVMRAINDKANKLISRNTALVKQLEDQNAVVSTMAGAGDGTKKTREAMDKMVFQVPAGTPHWFLTAEGMDAFAKNAEVFTRAGTIASESLLISAQAMADGRFGFNEEQVNNFFKIYGTIADKDTPLGDQVNPFRNSLTSEQFGILDTVHNVLKLSEGTDSAAEVYATMRSRLTDDNVKFEALMTQVTGDTTGVDFVKEVVGEENHLAVQHFIPLIKYMVAAQPDKAAIESHITNMMNNEFKMTDGYVYDNRAAVSFGTPFRSRHALSREISNYGDRIRAVQNFNQYLASIGVKYHIPRQERYFREMGDYLSFADLESRDKLDRLQAGLDPDSTPAFLVPLDDQGTREKGGTKYVLGYLNEDGNLKFVEKEDGSHIYVSGDMLRRSIAPKKITSTGNALYDEMIRSEMAKQGTSRPMINDDMSTISIDPAYIAPESLEGFELSPLDTTSFSYFINQMFN